MLLRNVLQVVLWSLATLAIFAACVFWFADAESGKVGAWVILPFFWGGAMVAAGIHQLAQLRDPLARYLARHKPLAGPRRGAAGLIRLGAPSS
jgi:hypothetical protein